MPFRLVIKLQVLSDAGLFDTLHNYSVYMVDNDTAAIGDNSLSDTGYMMTLGPVNAQMFSGTPSVLTGIGATYYQQAVDAGYPYCVSYRVKDWGDYTSYNFYMKVLEQCHSDW